MEIDAYVEKVREILNSLDDGMKRPAIALAILQELSKDRRMDEIRAERESREREGATEKQLAYLQSLGVECPEGLTKAEASRMIDHALGNR